MLPSAAQRLARWLITAVACAYTVITLTHFQNGVAYGLPAAATMVAVLAAHFVNMRAGLRDERPPLHPLPLVLQAVVTYLPDLTLPGGGSALAAPLLAGALLVFLPLPWGSALIVLMMLYEGWALWAGPGFAFLTAFYVMTVPTTGAMTYALVRLTRVTAELQEARAELADAAVLKERLRISRDLHDGLGRSLTAIALKGDLAGRLIERDPASARTEIGELVQVAREAAQDVRQVARGYRAMSLSGEVDRAVALLESSGVSVQAHLAHAALPDRSEQALAWGVREGVTNILRHSRATTCTITTSVHGGTARLEIANDGAEPPEPGTTGGGLVPGAGTGAGAETRTGAGIARGAAGAGVAGGAGGGLTGLAERAAQAGGTCTATPTDGGFVLAMEVSA
ncbi:histidine kinase [Nonomuraea sp. NPDC049419]|uniref:sensor histidine kinase n=1 Tax=Nonomuraea sp. NPDC049419 TaxID=3155772 RepID=UPI00342D04C6